MKTWRKTATSWHANFVAVYQRARGVLEIQAHVFRFNGKHDKGAGVGSIGMAEQYRCPLFQGLISGVGVVGCAVAFGAQLP